MKAIIKLFRAIPITSKEAKQPSEKLLQETIKRGFVFSPIVISNYSEQELFDLIKVIEKEVGLTPEQMNNTFQKNWGKIATSNILDLVREQLIHYFTTYGFQYLGIYSDTSVFVPAAELKIPTITEDIKIVVIKGYTKEEIREKTLALLNSGIALGEDTLKNVLEGVVFAGINEKDIDLVKNREAKAALYDFFGFFPEQPVEFLRYILYKITGKTLIIKNKETYEAIHKNVEGKIDIVMLFQKYQQKFGLEKLSEIFYRFKPLFLALRSNSNLKPIINKIRRLAVKHHKPFQDDFLNSITAHLKLGEKIDRKILSEKLSQVTIFRKIRLAQALNYKINQIDDSILYKIRNGKSYATVESRIENIDEAREILDIILKDIHAIIRKNIQGKKIFIPKNIHYALPATEKQFTGTIPSCSSITVDENMIFGVYWEDTKRTIDLDLSLINTTNKLGWDGQYRNTNTTILFSGDLTCAPKPIGAAELFYVMKQAEESYILFLNYYNFIENDPVQYKIIIAKDELENFDASYMIDPNKILCISKSTLTVKQNLIGLIITTNNGAKFYFNESSIGRSTVSKKTEYTKNTRNYLFNYCNNVLLFNDILSASGAILTNKKEEADIDLSPENLEKDSFLKLLS